MIFFFFQRSDLAGSNWCNASRQIQCILGQCPAYVVDILLCDCCKVEHCNTQVQIPVDIWCQSLFLGEQVYCRTLEQE